METTTSYRQKVPVLAHPTEFNQHYPMRFHSTHPPIVELDKILSPSECQYLINLARPKLRSSTMIVNNKEIVSQSRSSRSAFLTPNGRQSSDPVLKTFLERISQISGFPLSHIEGLKIVNYQPGQQYLAHHDYFREHTNFLKGCGERVMTILVYLNDLAPEAGGTTSFPNLGLKLQPKAGTGVMWLNTDLNGQYFEQTLHSGDPLLKGEKWAINVWIREHSYS